MNRLNEYVEKLDSVDETERAYAAEDIGYLNDPEGAWALLVRLGKESSLAVRDVIFQALIRIESTVATEGVIELLDSQDPQLRNQAVDVLRHKGLSAIPFLKRLMRTDDKDIRKLILDILKGTHTSGVEDIYASALSDKDVNVVITAVENLGAIRSEEFRSQIEDFLEPDAHPMLTSACLGALVEIGNGSSLTAIRRCYPQLAILDDFSLATCLKAIGVFGAEREFDEVASLLSIRLPRLRSPLLAALIALHPSCRTLDVKESLLGLLRLIAEDQDQPVCRYQAVLVLGFWGSRADVYAFLTSSLSSPERLVRLAAAESLYATNQPGLESIFAARIQDETDEEVLQVLTC
jgi:HEAT repeat protein